eukprot:g27414.t1
MEASRISQPAEVGMPGLPRSPHGAATGKAVSLGNEVAATHLSSHRRAARSYPEQGEAMFTMCRACHACRGALQRLQDHSEAHLREHLRLVFQTGGSTQLNRCLPLRLGMALQGCYRRNDIVKEPAVSQTSHVNAFADEARPPRQPARRPNTEKTVEKAQWHWSDTAEDGASCVRRSLGKLPKWRTQVDDPRRSLHPRLEYNDPS